MKTVGGIQNFFKIGHTSNTSSGLRRQKNQTGCPLRVITVKEMDGTVQDEARLHKELAKHRSWGEWFHDNKETRSMLGLGEDLDAINECRNPSKTVRETLEQLFECNPGKYNPKAIPIKQLTEKYGLTEAEIEKNAFIFFTREITGRELEAAIRRVSCHQDEMDTLQKFAIPVTMVGRTGSTFAPRMALDVRI